MTLRINPYAEITPELRALASLCQARTPIDEGLYAQHDVKRGLRDLNGKGVVTGLTEVSEILSSRADGQRCEGELYFRGIPIADLVHGCLQDGRPGFEETFYLLLFGALPTRTELDAFTALLASYRTLPTNFVRDIILKAPTPDMMNTLARGVLTLYGYDPNANDLSLPNVLRQCLQLTSLFPLLSVYGYQAYSHYIGGKSLFIHPPKPGYSTAENLLHCLRPDSSFTPLEARVLDLALILHAEHGGGNNSTFTMHVVTSSGTDTYSAVAASLASLKGPKHGGANLMVVRMMEDIRRCVRDWRDDEALSRHLDRLLQKEAFDRSGLIYGMGHAVYSISDPRATLLAAFAQKLSEAKGRGEEYALYSAVARLAPQRIGRKRRIYKGVSPNVDFYSGFIYSMLDLPLELYTPLFAVARMAGWSAHRIEELLNAGKIIRPAYKAVCPHRPYVPMERR